MKQLRQEHDGRLVCAQAVGFVAEERRISWRATRRLCRTARPWPVLAQVGMDGP